VPILSGLGTSTAKEAKEYFSDMARHRIPFRYSNAEDDTAIELVSDVITYIICQDLVAFDTRKQDCARAWFTELGKA